MEKEKIKTYCKESAITCFICLLSSVTGFVFQYAGFPETNIVIIYLFGVVMTARLTNYLAFGVISSVMATFAFNYLFTKPIHTFAVSDPSYLITFAVMIFTAIATSTMTIRMKKSMEEARKREIEKNAYKEKSEREHYRGNILRAISHDLRTPLSGIMGTSEMIMDMSSKTEPRFELAKGIWKDADWLHTLVENILNMTRVEEGRLTIQKQPEVVDEIIENALEIIKKRAPEYDIQIELPDDILMVPMDAKLIIQVLVNLLDNAIKHSTVKQKITVTVEEKPKCAVFIVSDNGEGISEEDLPNIFEMFYTSRKNSADSKRGVGFGLPICDAIVKAHGGTINAENIPEGGARFTFTLPLAADEGEVIQSE